MHSPHPVQKFGIFWYSEKNRFDAPELRLGVEACRLVGLDPDQLSLQAPFSEGLLVSQLAMKEGKKHLRGLQIL